MDRPEVDVLLGFIGSELFWFSVVYFGVAVIGGCVLCKLFWGKG